MMAILRKGGLRDAVHPTTPAATVR
jgi:hypothetical protein